MAGFGDVKLSDRGLEEYIRQQKLTEELPKKYPNISALIGPENIGKSDIAVMGALANKVNPNGPISQAAPKDPLELQREAERQASLAYSKDVAKTENVNDLLAFLRKRDNIDYNVKAIPDMPKKLSGFYNADEDTMVLPGNVPANDPNLLDTAIHEHGHARDRQRTSPVMSRPGETLPIPGMLTSTEERNTLLPASAENRLGDVAENISKEHFNKSGSHSLNEFLKAVKDLANKEAVQPDYKSKYSEIDKLFKK